MHDRIDPLRREHRIERGRIADVALDQLSPANVPAMPEQQAVEHDAFMPRRRERLGAMAADIAGASGNQDTCHDDVELCKELWRVPD